MLIDGKYLSINPWLTVGSVMVSVSDHGDAATVWSRAEDRPDLHESEIGHFTSACGNRSHDLYQATTLPGDAARGMEVFKTACSSCHRIGETGRAFGPDLLSVSNQTKINLLTMILEPEQKHRSRIRWISHRNAGR